VSRREPSRRSRTPTACQTRSPRTLARVYPGPEVTFPPMPDPPTGIVSRITVEHVGGIGPWV